MGHKNYFIDISCEHFKLLKLAKKNLFEALYIEDKLNLVLENYAEFEQELFNHAINNMLFSTDDWSSKVNEIHTVNRRIVNLLTTCRLYIDQIIHNIRSIYGANSEQERAIKEQKSQEYDSDRLGYCVMEAMRNYVQHRELPILTLSPNMRLIENSSGFFRKRTIKLSIDINTLQEDKKFKQSVLTRLQNLGGDVVEFIPLIRQYLVSIGRIHLKIRELLSSDLLKWEETIQSPISKYQEVTGYTSGLRVVSIDESKNTETISVFVDVIKRRQMLENKNRHLTHYSFHFISNEAPEFTNESQTYQ